MIDMSNMFIRETLLQFSRLQQAMLLLHYVCLRLLFRLATLSDRNGNAVDWKTLLVPFQQLLRHLNLHGWRHLTYSFCKPFAIIDMRCDKAAIDVSNQPSDEMLIML